MLIKQSHVGHRWVRLAALVSLVLLQINGANSDDKRVPISTFQLPGLNGEISRLSDFAGKVVIVNFWATWCAPCRAEFPSMNRAWAKFRGEPIHMLAINVGEDPAAVKRFTQDYPVDFPVLLDPTGTMSQRWQVRGMPTTIIVNPEGIAIYTLVGRRDWDDKALLAQVRALVRKKQLNQAQLSALFKD